MQGFCRMGQSAEFNKSEGMRNRPRVEGSIPKRCCSKGKGRRNHVVPSVFLSDVYYAAVQMSMCTVPGWNSITSLVVVATPSTDTRV